MRVVGVQRMDIDPRAKTVCPYPQNPRETRRIGTNPRAGSIQRMGVYLRGIDAQRTDIIMRVELGNKQMLI